MISDTAVFVWIWLPNHLDPVVAGKLSKQKGGGLSYVFVYGRSYLKRANAIPLYGLPLGETASISETGLPGAIRDSSPDAWGRRVLLFQKLGKKGSQIDPGDFDELFYLLGSSSDRIGSLDFQLSEEIYEPRHPSKVSSNDLRKASELFEEGAFLPEQLVFALYRGTSVGGARPKALLDEFTKKYIAKFSSSSDFYPVIQTEFIAMELAKRAGLNVAPVSLIESSNKKILLVERFDRYLSEQGWHRKSLVSALSLLKLDELMARYASYQDLADIIRHQFRNPKADLRELFQRMTFNVLMGNTDDHARNHSAFWDGSSLELTPAYDICPQLRSGGFANQAMLIFNDRKESQLKLCLSASSTFQLSKKEGIEIILHQISILMQHWEEVTNLAGLNSSQKRLLLASGICHPYAFETLDQSEASIMQLYQQFRSRYMDSSSL